MVSSLRSMLKLRGTVETTVKACRDDVAGEQPRHVDVAGATCEQWVASPEQRVGVQIGDQQSAMQGLGFRRSMIRTGLQRMVLLALDDGGHQQPRQHQETTEDHRNDQEPFHRHERNTAQARAQ